MVGYNVKNLDEIESIYKCPRCSLLLRNTVQFTNCGHRHCQSCLSDQQETRITCFECNQLIPREELKPDRGFQNDMKDLFIFCILCDWSDVLKNYQTHLDTDHPNPICKYCNERFISINDFNSHQRFNCTKITISCPLKSFGCDVEIIRAEITRHYLSMQHQYALMNFVHQIRGRTSHQMPYITYQQSNEIDEAIDAIVKSIETLDGDIRRVGREHSQSQTMLQSISEKLPTLAQSINEQNTFVDSLGPYQINLEQDIQLMKQAFNGLNAMSYDGTYIWRITDVHEKMLAAQSGAETSIYSPPFYSSPTGYKCCLRFYLNGDGVALKTHASLFFVLMHGDYDAILTFPFCFDVIFGLYDQTNQQQYIIDIFRPDRKSNSFQRPRSAMNIACGIPKFVDLKLLQQENSPYIRDNTMFIKVIINFDNLTKEMLPEIFRINPALTRVVQ